MSFSAAGNTSTMRSMVLAALEVCSVPNTRWPVSAAVSARRIVSRSRISPTRIASGSSRSAERSALANDSVCGPTSRWLTRHFLRFVHELDRVFDRQHVAELVFVQVVDHRRQRGRSCPSRSGRCTSTRPRGLSDSSANTLGALSCSSVRILLRNRPEHRAGAAVLVEGVDAKARQALDLEREVALESLFVVLALASRS